MLQGLVSPSKITHGVSSAPLCTRSATQSMQKTLVMFLIKLDNNDESVRRTLEGPKMKLAWSFSFVYTLDWAYEKCVYCYN